MVNIVPLQGQTKVVAPDGTVWIIQNGTPEKVAQLLEDIRTEKYKGGCVPTVEEFPTPTEKEVEKLEEVQGIPNFNEADFEKNDEVDKQIEAGKTEQVDVTTIEQSNNEVKAELDGEVTLKVHSYTPKKSTNDKQTHVQAEMGVQDHSDVEIIEYSHHFSPYKSHLARELSDEDRQAAREHRRFLNRLNWDWEHTIEISSSDEKPVIEDFTSVDDLATSDSTDENEIADTADSLENFENDKNVPDVIIKGHIKFFHFSSTQHAKKTKQQIKMGESQAISNEDAKREGVTQPAISGHLRRVSRGNNYGYGGLTVACSFLHRCESD
ncbi:hypothetical protein SSX86_018109 [Deinandra increscens subsp. villosa]|uniref:Uncharacterized protein n=1 Tax=Deinandra increscens subsp. villosa TaxID=3103831 RepID=A0AAP0GUH1_9ASTR